MRVKRSFLPKGVFLLGAISFLNDSASEAIYPILPLFLSQQLGAGPLFLGLLEGLSEALASLLKIFAGNYTDQKGGRERFVVSGYLIAAVARPFLAFASSPLHILTIRMIDRTGKGLRSAPRDALLSSFVSPDQRGRAFGFHRAMDNAGSVLGPLLAFGFFYFRPQDFRGLFLFAAIPGLMAVVLSLWLSSSEKKTVKSKFQFKELFDLKLNSEQKIFFISLIFFTLGNSTDAFLLLRLGQLGISTKWLPVVWAGLHVVKSWSNSFFGSLSDTLGYRKMIVAGWALYAAVYLAFAFSNTLPPFLFAFFTYGLFYGLTEGTEKALISQITEPEKQGTVFGLYHCTIGMGTLPASLIFGFLWQSFGISTAFIYGSAMALIAGMILYSNRWTHRTFG